MRSGVHHLTMFFPESMPANTLIGNLPVSTMERTRCRGLVGVGLLMALWAMVAPASEIDASIEHVHHLAPISADLAWDELVEQALINYPHFVELSARDAEARALAERARSWLSGQPSMLVRYQTDRFGQNNDLREYEMGLELPLWRRGQRQAARSLGAAAGSESEAAALALRHELIGLLRMVLWEVERADNAVALAEDGINTATELVRVVERRYEAGDLPLSDTLLVRSTKLEREAVLIESEAMLVDAHRAYLSLSGLDVRPSDYVESLSALENLNPSHPWLLLADAELDRARANLELVHRAVRGTPTLTLAPRRERASFSDFDADSIGITVAIPFGGQAHKGVETAAVAREVAEAEAERAELLRQLDIDLHEARHSLVVIDASLELARERNDLAAESLRMGEIAFGQGEITLFELLRWDESARVAQREAESLEIERQRAIAQVNQAIGEWP